MGAAFTSNKLSEEERKKRKEINFKAAKNWIRGYKKSGCAEIMLSECEKMTLNKVALITKFLLNETDLPVRNIMKMPDPFFTAWQKTFLIFRNSIGNSGNITELKEVNSEDYLDRINTLEHFRDLMKSWNPEDNDNFTYYFLYFGLPSFFRNEKKKENKLKEITTDAQVESERSQEEPATERMEAILYIAILFIRELPHKILIFIYVSLFYRNRKNVDWDEFIRKDFNKTLRELYDYAVKQEVNNEFTSMLRESYGEVILKTPVSHYYGSKPYVQFLSLTGFKKPVGDVVLRTFFNSYYKGKSGNPDFNKIKQVMEKWVSRIKFEAQQVLIDKERFLDLNDIMKIS